MFEFDTTLSGKQLYVNWHGFTHFSFFWFSEKDACPAKAQSESSRGLDPTVEEGMGWLDWVNFNRINHKLM